MIMTAPKKSGTRARGRPADPEKRTLMVEIRTDLRLKLDDECREEGRTLRMTLERILDAHFRAKLLAPPTA